MDEEIKKDGKEFSFGDFIRTIWSRKFLALIIALAITLAGTLALYFGYNAVSDTYESLFSINFSVSDSGLIEYPDGRSRNFRDFVSYDNLTEIKKSETYSKALSAVDVAEMVSNGGISISQSGKDSTTSFVLKIDKKYFPSEEVAETFVDAIVQTVTRDLLANIEKSAESVRSGFKKSAGNERKVDFLTRQIAYYNSRFNNIKNMSSDALAEINYLSYALTALEGSLHTNYYESDVEVLRNFVNVRVELERQLEIAQAVLDNLMKAGADASDGTGSVIIQGAQIVEYTEKVNTLTKQIDDIDNYLKPYKDEQVEGKYNIPDKITDEGNEDFDDALLEVLNGVCELSTKYEAEHWLYYPAVSYEGSPINLVHGLDLVFCILISLIVGIVVAAIVAYIVARRSQKKVSAEIDNKSGEENKE